MSFVPFADLPDDARIWIFGAGGPLPPAVAERLLRGVQSFVDRWTAHGSPVVGSFDWRYDTFLVVAADEAATGVSGCSIDSLYHTLKQLEEETGITLLDSSRVWYRDELDAVRSVTREDFRGMVEREEVGDETMVFDNTARTVGALRAGEWERPFHESWHVRAFPSARSR